MIPDKEKANAYAAEYRAAHREELAEKQQLYYADKKETIAAYQKAYRAAHVEERKADRSARYAANKEKERAQQAQYFKNNPDQFRADRAKRRALVRNAEGTYTAADIKAIYEKQEGNCYWCGKHVGKEYHVDHFMPLSKGGSNWPDNLVIACPQCNLSKGAKLPDEWSR